MKYIGRTFEGGDKTVVMRVEISTNYKKTDDRRNIIIFLLIFQCLPFFF
jgi:hypothetical protein